MKRFAVLILLLFAGPIMAQPEKLPLPKGVAAKPVVTKPLKLAPLAIDGELKVPPYRIVTLTAQGDLEGAGFIWDVSPEDPCHIKDRGSELEFCAPPGVYRVKLRVVRSVGGKFEIDSQRVTVTIDGKPPTPPEPPEPPKPPEPPPPPPDALTLKLQAAFALDTGSAPDKLVWLAAIKAVYDSMPAHVDSLPTSATTMDMLADLKAAVRAVLPDPPPPADPTALVKVRRAIADEVNASIGLAGPTPLDRAKAKQVFSAIAKSLGGVR